MAKSMRERGERGGARSEEEETGENSAYKPQYKIYQSFLSYFNVFNNRNATGMQQLRTLLTFVFGENHLYGSPHTTIPGKRERYGHEEKGRGRD